MKAESLLQVFRKVSTTDIEFSFVQIQILLEIFQNPGELRAVDLSARVGVSAPACGRTIDRLSDVGFRAKPGLGWVRRIPDVDRRFKRLECTPAGRRFVEALLVP